MTTIASVDRRRALRRHRIIERPRLLALLEGSSARVRTLVAPAGYGKTTLAEQWLGRGGRRGAWFTARRASTDVAALALGVAQAATALVPECDLRLREHLRAVPNAASRYQVLAELLGEDLALWPREGWLVIDEYQELAGALDAERFVAALVASSPVQLLIASRQRPCWVTSRELLHGEVLELNQTVLAMDAVEAAEVLATDVDAASGLVALANGWPALIGLASVTPGGLESAREGVPESLYRFFADEIFEALGEEMRRALAILAVAPILDRDLADKLLPGAAGAVCDTALNVGVLVEREAGLVLHPIARSFLEEWRAELGLSVPPEVADTCLRHYRGRRDWDAAFEVIARLGPIGELEPLLLVALDELLDAGRLSTLETWCELAAQEGLAGPPFDVARAEVALRQGRHAEAQAYAEAAAAEGSPLTYRALSVAARAAHMASREEEGLDLYRRAEQAASSDAERRDARWGQVICAAELELPLATEMLSELREGVRFSDPRDVVRAATCSLAHQLRLGRLDLTEADIASQLVSTIRDPFVISGFLVAYANGLALAARYKEAAKIASNLASAIKQYRLDFARQYHLFVAALADSGLRRWSKAHRRLVEAVSIAKATHDIYAQQICYALQMRLYAQQGRCQAALALELPPSARTVPGAYADMVCARAFVLALTGRLERARRLADEARECSVAIEPRVLTAAVDAVVALKRRDRSSLSKVYELEEIAFTTGAVDLLVTAYRSSPDILAILLRRCDPDDRFVMLIRKAGDGDLAEAIGYPLPTDEDPRSRLTPREREVYELVCGGLSNREIAEALVISVATAKLHVQHIFQKLGVNSRRDLIVQAALERAERAMSSR